MTPPQRIVLLCVAFPLAVGAVEGVSRPDLFAPMIDHVFGVIWVTAVLFFASVGGVLVGLAATVDRTWVRVLLAVSGLLGGTLQSVFLVVFGPIVFAFMFGDAGK